MTKEIRDIVQAYHVAVKEGRKTALATVVHVQGSSYRMPGARMLVEDNGKITGAISGGCLEGDALRKALQAMSQNTNRLVTYNTLEEDDVEFGVQLGCNGIVHILFEPINSHDANHPVAILERTIGQRKPVVLVTLFCLEDVSRPQPGTCLLMNVEEEVSVLADTALGSTVCDDARTVLAGSTSLLKHYDTYAISAFFELVPPPVSLVVIGAGNDVMPLADMAAILGWQVTIADGRATHVTAKRFPRVQMLLVAKAADIISQVTIDERTAIVIMTHNYNYDVEVVKSLASVPCSYIGILGPARRLQRIFNDLQAQDIHFNSDNRNAIYGPVGLDIGAETPEEIALSVIAEVRAVLSHRAGGHLRDRQGGIHSRPQEVSFSEVKCINSNG